MRFCSTRGGERGKLLSEVVVAGYAADGGLYVPEEVPRLDDETWYSWRQLSYTDLAAEVFSVFDSERLLGSIDESKELFREAFESFYVPEVVRLVRLRDGTKIAELFHGPTLAFKDLALTGLGVIVDALMEKTGRRCVALVATSGDTGSAAATAVSKMKHADIVVLYPKGLITQTQELQMTTIASPNVHIIEGEGNSDELDVPVKLLTDDEDIQRQYNLAIFNSINVLRILLQIPYYFFTYFRVLDDEDYEVPADRKCSNLAEVLPTVTFAIPTGAAGNLTGGCFARAMGLPIDFVVCNNSNAAVHDFIRTAALSKPNSAAHHTLACAMDIKAPYNVERILYALSNGDTGAVNAFMTKFENDGSAELPTSLKEILTTAIIDTCVATDEEISATIKQCWLSNGYVLCPHTATAVAYADRRRSGGGGSNRLVCVATASPAKFPEALAEAGVEPQAHPAVDGLASRRAQNKTLMTRDQDWVQFLKQFLARTL